MDEEHEDNWVSSDNYMKYLKDSSVTPITKAITDAICDILKDYIKEYWNHIDDIISAEA